MRGGGIVTVQSVIEGGSQIADPSAMYTKVPVIRKGGFSPVRNQRRSGGFSPASNQTLGNLKDMERCWKELRDPVPVFPGYSEQGTAAKLDSYVVNAHMDSLAGSSSGGIIPAGPKMLGTVTNKTLSGTAATMPRVTYSSASNTSKSYSPGSPGK